MDSFSQLMTGFSDALTPENLLLALVGVTLGTLVGAARTAAGECDA